MVWHTSTQLFNVNRLIQTYSGYALTSAFCHFFSSFILFSWLLFECLGDCSIFWKFGRWDSGVIVYFVDVHCDLFRDLGNLGKK